MIDPAMKDEVRVTVIATGFGKVEEKSVSRFNRKVAPITFNREPAKEIPAFSFSVKEHNKDLPAFMRKKVNERFDELKLAEPSDFSMEDEDRFDIPTFLRKQAD